MYNNPTAAGATRREFLSTVSLVAAAGGVGINSAELLADEIVESDKRTSLLDSPPVLQCPTPDGMTVAWAVNGPATGWVEWGQTRELGQRADTATNGLLPYRDRFMSVRLTGLPQDKPIFYRVGSAPIEFKNAYDVRRGATETSEMYEFRTPSIDAESATFAVINDTHENLAVLEPLTAQLKKSPGDFTIWNGDIFNDIRSDEQIVASTLRPADSDFAATRPLLFTSGNHDVRGGHARSLASALVDWPEQGALGRCFAVRQGPLALIGLDTGEDKPDRHPVFAGLASFEPYRKAQAEWLAATLARPDIATAPYIVVCCHIPLWGLEGHNGGDTLEGYAYYSQFSQTAWHPALAKAGVQLVISGHMHEFRYDAPTEKHPYAQLVGGGPRPQIATIIRGAANAERLEVTAYKLDETKLGSWQFTPRKV
jgi:predicted phosphodiesterase